MKKIYFKNLLAERNSPMYKQWREFILKKDNYTCQLCGNRKFIEAHHIMSFALYEATRYNIENGITLCKKCHKKFHRKYGKWIFPSIYETPEWQSRNK